jgi:hypothetical protein
MQLISGTRLGRYEIRSQLGAGGCHEPLGQETRDFGLVELKRYSLGILTGSRQNILTPVGIHCARLWAKNYDLIQKSCWMREISSDKTEDI